MAATREPPIGGLSRLYAIPTLQGVQVNVQQVITAVKRDLGAVAKGKRMEAGPAKYNYRSIDDVLNKLHDGMVEHGCLFSPNLRSVTQTDAGETKYGTKQMRTVVDVGYFVYGPEGDFITAATPGEAIDSGDKGTNKAMTTAFKVLLTQLLAIPFETDDPDDHHVETATQSPVPATPQAGAAQGMAPSPPPAQRAAKKVTAKKAAPQNGPERLCATCNHALGSSPVTRRQGANHHTQCLLEGMQNVPAEVTNVFPGTTEVDPDDPEGRPFTEE